MSEEAENPRVWTFLATLPLVRPVAEDTILEAFGSAVRQMKMADGLPQWILSEIPPGGSGMHVGAQRLLHLTPQYQEGRARELENEVGPEVGTDPAFQDALARYGYTYSLEVSPRGVVQIRYAVPEGVASGTEDMIRFALPFMLFPLVEAAYFALCDSPAPTGRRQDFGYWNTVLAKEPTEALRLQWYTVLDKVAERSSSKILDDVCQTVRVDYGGRWWRRALAPFKAVVAASQLSKYSILVNAARREWLTAKRVLFFTSLAFEELRLEVADALPGAEYRNSLDVAEQAWAQVIERHDSMAQLMGVWLGLAGLVSGVAVGVGLEFWSSIPWWSWAALSGIAFLSLVGLYKTALSHVDMMDADLAMAIALRAQGQQPSAFVGVGGPGGGAGGGPILPPVTLTTLRA